MSIYYPINFEKSIKNQSLRFQPGIKIFFLQLINYIAALIIIIMLLGIIAALQPLIEVANIILIVVLFIYFIWQILNLIFQFKMVKIVGKERERNKKDITNVLSIFYRLDNLSVEDNMISDVKLTKFIFPGRVITCLINDNTILLNVITLEAHNFMATFSGLYNYLKCKRIAKRFILLQQTTDF